MLRSVIRFSGSLQTTTRRPWTIFLSVVLQDHDQSLQWGSSLWTQQSRTISKKKKKKKKRSQRQIEEDRFELERRRKLLRLRNLHEAAKWKRVLSACDFWFSKKNLLEDYFVTNALQKHRGWMPIRTLLTFPKFEYWTNAKLLVDAFNSSAAGRYIVSYDQSLLRPTTATTASKQNPKRKRKPSIQSIEQLQSPVLPAPAEFPGTNQLLPLENQENDESPAHDLSIPFRDPTETSFFLPEPMIVEHNAERSPSTNEEISLSTDQQRVHSLHEDIFAVPIIGKDNHEANVSASTIETIFVFTNESENRSEQYHGEFTVSEQNLNQSNMGSSSNDSSYQQKTATENGSILVLPAQHIDNTMEDDVVDDDDYETDRTDSEDNTDVDDESDPDHEWAQNYDEWKDMDDWTDDDDNDDSDDDDTDDHDVDAGSDIDESERDVPSHIEETKNPEDAFVRHRRVSLAFLNLIDLEREQDLEGEDHQEEYIPYPFDFDSLLQDAVGVEIPKKRKPNIYSTKREIRVIRRADELQVFCGEVVRSVQDSLARHKDPNACAVGFDVEYCTLDHDIRNYLPAMIQLSSPAVDGPIGLIWLDKFKNKGRDVLSNKVFRSLASILSNPSILKVGVSATTDAINLARWWNIEDTKDVRHFFAGVMDLEAELNEATQGKSLQEMCKSVLDRTLSKLKGPKKNSFQKRRGKKSYKTSHWRTDVLTDPMKRYAAHDASSAVDIWMKIHGFEEEAPAKKKKTQKKTKTKEAKEPLQVSYASAMLYSNI